LVVRSSNVSHHSSNDLRAIVHDGHVGQVPYHLQRRQDFARKPKDDDAIDTQSIERGQTTLLT